MTGVVFERLRGASATRQPLAAVCRVNHVQIRRDAIGVIPYPFVGHEVELRESLDTEVELRFCLLAGIAFVVDDLSVLDATQPGFILGAASYNNLASLEVTIVLAGLRLTGISQLVTGLEREREFLEVPVWPLCPSDLGRGGFHSFEVFTVRFKDEVRTELGFAGLLALLAEPTSNTQVVRMRQDRGLHHGINTRIFNHSHCCLLWLSP